MRAYREEIDQLNSEIGTLRKYARLIADLKAEQEWLRNEYIQKGAIIEAVEAALDGEEVSDFLESFPLVRRVMDLKAERDALKYDNEQISAITAERDAWERRFTTLVGGVERATNELVFWRGRTNDIHKAVDIAVEQLRALCGKGGGE